MSDSEVTFSILLGLLTTTSWKEASFEEVFRVWGQNTFLGGQDFCLYYLFRTSEQTFWTQQNLGAQKIGGKTGPECPPWLRAWS